MYRKMLNYLRGQVTVEVESAAPERVLNLCAAHNIPFWELEWLSEIRLRAVTSRAALPRLQAALAQTDAAVTVLRRRCGGSTGGATCCGPQRDCCWRHLCWAAPTSGTFR